MIFKVGIKICGVMGEVIRPSKPKLFDADNFIRIQVSIDLSLAL